MERGERTMRKRGALVIAHGSSKSEWVAMVDEAVERVEVEMPVAVGFLGVVEGRGIHDAVRSLEDQGVEEMIAVPLIASGASNPIADIAHLLRLQAPFGVETDVSLTDMDRRARLCRLQDDHAYIAQNLTEGARALGTDAQNGCLLLDGNGNDTPVLRE